MFSVSIATCILSVHYPGDYGFIPSTLSEDGDPLDVLVLVDAGSFPGCVMEVRPIGLLEMLDQGVADEKVLAVGKGNPRYTDVWNYSEIYPHILKEITHFFSIYKDLEGKRVEIKGWHDAAYARDKVIESQKRFPRSERSCTGTPGAGQEIGLGEVPARKKKRRSLRFARDDNVRLVGGNVGGGEGQKLSPPPKPSRQPIKNWPASGDQQAEQDGWHMRHAFVAGCVDGIKN